MLWYDAIRGAGLRWTVPRLSCGVCYTQVLAGYAMLLRDCYTMSGIDLVHGTAHLLLRARYGMCGTDLAYGAMRLLSGTDLACCVTRLLLRFARY
eukprot:1980247-Rhodomonas_salina.1